MKSLRKRLARRFAIIGPDHGFQVRINGEEVGVEDRDFFPKIQYLWSIGDVGDRYERFCTNAIKTGQIPGTIDQESGFEVTGWVGTFDERKSMEDHHNTITILAWENWFRKTFLRTSMREDFSRST